jgi:hypothetical protein
MEGTNQSDDMEFAGRQGEMHNAYEMARDVRIGFGLGGGCPCNAYRGWETEADSGGWSTAGRDGTQTRLSTPSS